MNDAEFAVIGGSDDNEDDGVMTGGNGGAATFVSGESVSIDSSAIEVDGGNGGYSENGNGGTGGNAFVSIGGDLILTAIANDNSFLNVIGGEGGGFGMSGSGADGINGNASLFVNGAVSIDSSAVSVAGGSQTEDAGELLSGAESDGGSASVSIGSELILTSNSGMESNLSVNGGTGSSDGDEGSGGNGGDVSLIVAGPVSIDSSSVSVVGGESGEGSGENSETFDGNGGAASVSVGSLILTGNSELAVVGGSDGFDGDGFESNDAGEGTGGNGGGATFISSGSVSMDSSEIDIDGGIGGGSEEGNGGNGGDAFVSIGASLVMTGNNNDSFLNIVGGNGGFGGDDSGGGNGLNGSASLIVNGPVSIDSSVVSVTGGTEEDGDSGGLSGGSEPDGGSASVSIGGVGSELIMTSNEEQSSLSVIGGNGDDDWHEGSGGNGGDASLIVAGPVSIDSSSVSVMGGNSGEGSGASETSDGNGGSASISVGSLALTGNSEFAVVGGSDGFYDEDFEPNDAGDGTGGNGGGATFVSAESVSIDSSNVLVQGGNGGDSDNTIGGNGGDASVSIGSDLILAATNASSNFSINAGEGGSSDEDEALGGNNGSATLIVNGAVSMDSSLLSVMASQFGSSGGGNSGDIEGAGGNASVSMGALIMNSNSFYGDLNQTGTIATLLVGGGQGGEDAGLGDGGAGGTASLTVNGSVSINSSSVTVTGGVGGDGSEGNGGNGGNGGDASVSFGSQMLLMGDDPPSQFVVGGGKGGDTSGSAGNGGSASLILAGPVSVDSSSISVYGGTGGNDESNGFGSGGTGGDATVDAGVVELNHGSSIEVVGGNGGSSENVVGSSGNTSVTISSLDLIDAGSSLNVEAGVDGSEDEVLGSTSVYLGGLFGQGDVNITSGSSTLQIASGNFDGSINGDTGLEKVSAGTLILGGVNTYTGPTTVTNGVLAVDTNGTLGSSNGVTVGSLGGLDFINSSNAGSLDIENNGWTNFDNTSNAGNAFIDNWATLQFSANSQAGTAAITNNSNIYFTGSSSAQNAVISNQDFIAFNTQANAGNATIDNQGGIAFYGGSAGNATITGESGSLVFFDGKAQGGNASFNQLSGSAFDISYSDAGVTVGSISGEGDIFLGSQNLGVGTNNADMTLSGTIQDRGIYNATGGSLTKLGTGTLVLSGVNSYSGATNVDAGTLMVASSSALGTGNVNVNGGTLSTDGVISTINVSQNYSQAAGGTLKLGLSSATIFDQLLVVGNVSLGGTLQLTSPNSFTPTVGQAFGIISSLGNISGDFASVTDSFTGVKLVPVYFPTAVLLETEPTSFAQYAVNNANQLSVANALNNLSGRQASTLLVGLANVKASDYSQVFNQISPSNMTSLYSTNFQITQLQAGALNGRIASFLSGRNYSGNNQTASIDSNMMFASTMSAEEELQMAFHSEEVKDDQRWGGFVSGDSGTLNVNGNGEGYNAVLNGVTAGADYQVNKDMAFGLMVAYQNPNVTSNSGSVLAMNGGEVGLYGMAKSNGLYASILGEGGYETYNSQRVAFGGMAQGNTNGLLYSGQLGLGYQIQADNWTVGPIGSVQYTMVNVNGFQETGSLSPESFGYQGQDSLISNLGAQATGNLNLDKDMTLSPMVSATWLQEYDSQGGSIASSVGGSPFTVQGAPIGQSGIEANASLGVEWKSGLSLSAHYQGQFDRTNFDSQTFGGEMKFKL